MKTASYKLAGDIPEALRGTTTTKTGEDGKVETVVTPFVVKTREAETDDDMLDLVEGRDPSVVRRLAQAQLDIIVQRNIRNYTNGEEVAKLLGLDEKGNRAKDEDGNDVEPDVDGALAAIQTFADSYVYGVTKTAGTGVAAATKAKAAKADAIQAAAANDPELAAKLAALGITL